MSGVRGSVVHTGGRWVPPRIVRIPDLDTPKTYLTRIVLFRTPWGGIQLHKIHMADGDRHLHNHPRPFWSLILKGGYDEDVSSLHADFPRTWRRWSLHPFDLDEFHAIRRLHRTPTWSLVFVGQEQQVWGFLTDDGFIPADEYSTYLEEVTP